MDSVSRPAADLRERATKRRRDFVGQLETLKGELGTHAEKVSSGRRALEGSLSEARKALSRAGAVFCLREELIEKVERDLRNLAEGLSFSRSGPGPPAVS